MTHNEAVSFIKNAITASSSENWADLGSGSGTFTKALADLLPAGSYITAVDRDYQQLSAANIHFVKANFEKDLLPLKNLDGILMANALHYIADKAKLIQKLELLFADAPRFLIIEYDTERTNPWVPFPLSFTKLQYLFKAIGYQHIERLNERPSAYNSGLMYCALITR